MNQHQDFHPIDEKFRQVFENLPEAPAANGWDSPSEQVWQHVARHISTPTQLGFWQWTAAILLAAGLIFSLNQIFFKKEHHPAPDSPAVEQPAAPHPVQQVDNQPVEPPVPPPATDVQKDVSGKNKVRADKPTRKNPRNSTETRHDRAPQQQDLPPQPSSPPDTHKPASPKNSEMRQKMIPPNHHELEKQQQEGGN